MPRAGQILLLAAAIALNGSEALAQTDPGPFTKAQVTAGRAAFMANCAGCHGPALTGAGDAPALTGPGFNASWALRSTRELWQFIAASMPYGNAGNLSDETYTNVVAFLLAANGARPGPKPFTQDTGVKIDSIADGQTVTAVIRP
jgi:alcohol dehydrogenase (cytochrome c)